MSRILIRVEAWGVVWDRTGNSLASLTFQLKNTDGSAATHWSAETGGTSSTADLLTDGLGGATLSGADRWIEAGEYDVTTNGKTYRVNTTGLPSTVVSDSSPSAVHIGPRATGGVAAPYLRDFVSLSDFTGSDSTGATDTSVAWTSAATALGGNGTLFVARGTYLVSGSNAYAFQAPQNATGFRVEGAGLDSATVKLSSATPRFCDAATSGTMGAHVTYTNIAITDLTIDANSVGGNHHVIFGNYTNATQGTKVSFDRITIARVRTINVTNDQATNATHRWNIAITNSWNTSDGDSTQDYQKNMLFEDLDLGGGKLGVGVFATPSSGTVQANVFIDNITLNRCKWTAGAAPTAFYASTGFQIGSRGIVRRVRLYNCDALGAGDDGYEMDNVADLAMYSCTSQDSWDEGFFVVNLVGTNPWSSGGQGNAIAANGRDHQVCFLFHCRDYHTTALVPTSGVSNHRGFIIGAGSGANDMGVVILQGCSFHDQSAEFTQGGSSVYCYQQAIFALTIRDFKVEQLSGAISSAAGPFTPATMWLVPASSCKLRLERIHLNVTASITGGAVLSWYGIIVNCQSGTLRLEVQTVTVALNLSASGGSSVSNGNCAGLSFGRLTGGGTVTGTMRNVILDAWSTTETTVRPVHFDSNCTIGRLDIEMSDFTTLAGVTGADFYFASGTASGSCYAGAGVQWRNGIAAPPSGVVPLVNTSARQDLVNAARNVLAETVDIMAAAQGASTTSALASQELTIGLVGLVAGDVVKGVSFNLTVSGVTMTLFKVGLYDTSGNLLASSADQSGTINSTGKKEIAFSSAFPVINTAAYYIGVICVFSAGTVSITRGASSSLLSLAVDSGKTPIAKQTGQSDLPSPATFAGGNNANAAFHFMAYA